MRLRIVTDFIIWVLIFYCVFYVTNDYNAWLERNTITYCEGLVARNIIYKSMNISQSGLYGSGYNNKTNK